MDSHLVAAKTGDVGLLHSFLDRGLNIDKTSPFSIEMPSGRLRTFNLAPLHVAAFYQQTATVRFLLNAGANVNVLSTDEHRLTVLHILMFNSQSSAVSEIGEILIQANAANVKSSFTADLFLDLMPDKAEAIASFFPSQTSLKQTQSPKEQVDNTTALEEYIAAAKSGNIQKLKTFVGTKIDQKDLTGNALFGALTNNKPSSVRFLLDHFEIEIQDRHFFAAGTAARMPDADPKEFYQLLKDHKARANK
jgi:ankyrin repeat protein